jgi:hypothetical protein
LQATAELPNKGKLEQCGPGVANLIQLAFDAREMAIKLKAAPTTVDELVSVQEEQENERQTNLPIVVDVPFSRHAQYSSFLITPQFVSAVHVSFDPTELQLRRDLDIVALNALLNNLHGILSGRLVGHIKKRVKPKLQNKWVWEFARENLRRCAAAMLIMGHSRERLIGSGKSCLLKNIGQDDGSFLLAHNEVSKKEGCYLYWDKVNLCWRRSGKVNTKSGNVTSRGFGIRGKEHNENSKNSNLTSKFYRTFPSVDAPVPDSQLQLGFFEDLEQYCALGFSRQDKSHQSLYTTTGDGIFLWSDVMLHRIGEIKFPGAKVLADKQLHMVGYMIELCYDLALSSDHNISESAGFETPLGFWRSD